MAHFLFALPPSSSQLQCNHEKNHIRQIPIEEHYIKLYLLSKMPRSLKKGNIEDSQIGGNQGDFNPLH